MTQDYQSKQDYARRLRYARSRFRRINSLDLIPEDPSQEESNDEDMPLKPVVLSRSNSGIKQKLIPARPNPSLPLGKSVCSILWFWPNLLINIVLVMLRYVLYIPLSIAAPSFWLSAILWLFWKIVRFPVEFIKWVINEDNPSNSQRPGSYQNSAAKRTVLIRCGSTMRTLHLARSFYTSGGRFLVFEFDGMFGLARFSAAVDKCNQVPKSAPQNVDTCASTEHKLSLDMPVASNSPDIAVHEKIFKKSSQNNNTSTFKQTRTAKSISAC